MTQSTPRTPGAARPRPCSDSRGRLPNLRAVSASAIAVALFAVGCSPDPAAEETQPPEEAAPETATPENQSPDAAEEDGDRTEDPAEDAEDVESEDGADDGDIQEPGDATEDDPAEEDPTEPVIIEQTVWNFDTMDEVDLQVTIHPFLRIPSADGDLLNGLITYEVTSPEGEYHLDEHGVHPTEVRLVDTEDLRVSYPAYATDGSSEEHLADVESATVHAGEDPVRWAGVHPDPGTESTAVMLPYLGLVEGVGIVDPDELDTSDHLPMEEAVTELVEIYQTTWDLQVHRERAEGDVQIRESDEDVTITLDSDILFDIDEFALTDDADGALQEAAEELERAEDGELEIVGHTDDVRSLEHNEQLSEARAEAVHQRLQELVDLDDVDVSTSGRAFHEPVADNDTDQGRALNRRVDLHFTPSPASAVDTGATQDTDEAELPPTTGPVSEAGESIQVTGEHGGVVDVAVEELYSTGNLLVGRIRVEALEPLDGEEHAGPLAWALSFGDLGLHEGHANPYNPGHQADAVTLLSPQERIFPLEFGGTESFEGSDEDGLVIEQDDPWRSLTVDRGFGQDAEAEVGAWSVATVLWPQTGDAEIVVDIPGQTEHAERPYSEPWRAVDVPVEPRDDG